MKTLYVLAVHLQDNSVWGSEKVNTVSSQEVIQLTSWDVFWPYVNIRLYP